MKKLYFLLVGTLGLTAMYSFTENSENGSGGYFMYCDAKNSNECKIKDKDFVIYGTGNGHFGKTP